MTFEEWWDTVTYDKMSDNRKWLAEQAFQAGYNKGYSVSFTESEEVYEAGVQEGINRMYLLYGICPECKSVYGKHKMDCGRGR